VVRDGEEKAWKSSSQQAMMNTNGNNYALVVSPPEKSMMMMMMLFSSSVAEYYRCSDEERGRNCLRCFDLHSIQKKKLQQQLGALVLCS
jgi:hypothetical protein